MQEIEVMTGSAGGESGEICETKEAGVRSARQYLLTWLQRESAPWFIGEVVILPGFELRHRGEVVRPAAELNTLADFPALREMVKCREDGEFRPVRGHRGLKSGWRMSGLSEEGLFLALNWIYPAAVAIWAEYRSGHLAATEFRETAQRQTGMYRITQIITPQQLEQTVSENCRVDCLRRRLWAPLDPWEWADSEIPLICPEACNYLIGKAREVIKRG